MRPEDALPRWQFIGTSADPQQREDAISSCISQRAGLNWPSRLATTNYQGENIYFFRIIGGKRQQPTRTAGFSHPKKACFLGICPMTMAMTSPYGDRRQGQTRAYGTPVVARRAPKKQEQEHNDICVPLR